MDLAFVDGGLYDNLGALAVLRRGVSTIIICDACDTDLSKTCDWELKQKYSDVACLFGEGVPFSGKLITKKSYSKTLNERSKIFDSNEFMLLMKDMRKLQKDGKPLVRRKKMKLLQNKLAGFYESREVDVIFCFNGKVQDFEDKVKTAPKEGVDKEFPYFSTFKCDYNTQEVNKLSSLCSYSLVEGLKNVGFSINQVE